MAVLVLIYWFVDDFLLFLTFLYVARVLRWEKVFSVNIDILARVLRWGFFPILIFLDLIMNCCQENILVSFLQLSLADSYRLALALKVWES